MLLLLRTFLLLAASLVSATCSSKQAKSWDYESSGLESPSWPWDCHNILIVDEPATYAEVRNAYNITGYEFFVWNCFLECEDGVFELNAKVCVDATLENPVTRTPLVVPSFSTMSGFDPEETESSSLKSVLMTSEPSSTGPALESSSEKRNKPRGVGSWGLSWSTTTADSTSDSSTSGSGSPTFAISLGYTTSTKSTASEEYRSSPSSSAWELYPGFSPYTESCDASSKEAEDCRITMQDICDVSKSQYPACVDGKCQCRSFHCSRDSECEDYKQCREDDHEAVCEFEHGLHAHSSGRCQCRPRMSNCLSYDNEKHAFCNDHIKCTEHGFGLYPNFPQCVNGDSFYGQLRGECQCQHVDCELDEGLGDDELCRERVTCSKGDTPVCSVKYLNSEDDGPKGYCTCPLGFDN